MNFADTPAVAALQTVSIHIRHCWRMNSSYGYKLFAATLFQSTFAIAGE